MINISNQFHWEIGDKALQVLEEGSICGGNSHVTHQVGTFLVCPRVENLILGADLMETEILRVLAGW